MPCEQMKGLIRQKGALISIGVLTIMAFYPTVKYKNGLPQIIRIGDVVAVQSSEPKLAVSKKDSSRSLELPLDIGCIQTGSNLFTETGQSFHADDIEQCKEKCSRNFLYYVFNKPKLRCFCKDLCHDTHSLDPAYCLKSSSYSFLGIRGNTTGLLVSKYLSNSTRSCRCTSNSCESITCNNIGSDTSCWAGPQKTDLLKYKRLSTLDRCPDTEYTVSSLNFPRTNKTDKVCNQTNCLFCLSQEDMYGFWPVTNCSQFHPPKLSQEKQRLYKISPPITKKAEVTVFANNHVKDRIKVLLLAYYRSGSTFTSELFKNHPDAFYMFEPFHSVIPLPIASEREEIHDYLTNATATSITSLFNCNLLQLSPHTINKFLQSDRLSDYCQQSYTLDCMALFIAQCKARKLTAIKSIRVRMKSVEMAIEKYQQSELRVLLLLRDPRGIMRSRMAIKDGYNKKYRNKDEALRIHSKMLCKAMAEDAQIAKEIQKNHPNPIVVVHYEDIANYTKTAASYIYRTLEMDNPPVEVVAAISRLRGHKKGDAYSVYGRDSVATAYNWKKSLSFKQVRLIDEGCKDYYKYIGYEPVGSQQELSDPNNYHRTTLITLI
ncbi:hypothetical protein EB796_018437 [Bugula neritina]|uniref:Sulfotransferase domain-containing protein n=1 Tax=Bugula neritina TaxID=10212 RepID=A0A7J7JAI4_BUGNE|nr:hypothetical protein EB796_018437 [Bugula neritina]